MRKRLLFLLIGLICGILLFINYENINPLFVIMASGILILIFYMLDKNYIPIVIGIIIGFVISLNNFNNFKLKDINDSKAMLTIVDKKESSEGFRYFANVENKDIKEKSVFFSDENLDIGDILIADINIDLPNRNTNPNLFNYRNYLISKKIASIIEIDRIYSVEESKDFLLNLKNGFYNYIHNIFWENLSKNAEDFVISVILAENMIDEKDSINSLGLAHILAVSGLHIDMLMAFILFIFRKLNINYKAGYIIGIMVCLMYGYLIGFPFSVIRVLVINIIAFLSFYFRYPEDKIKSLLIAAIIILFNNPFAILSSGFVLSFIATSGVYLFYPKVKRFFKDNMLSKSIGFSSSIQLAVLPFTVYYFGYLNLMSILANFLVVPIFEISMYIIFMIIFTYPLFHGLLFLAFKLLDYLIVSILNLTSMLSFVDIFKLEFIHESIIVSIYLYILILIILYMKKNNKKIIKSFYNLSLFILLTSIISDNLNKEVSFSMIDIGQGDAFLLNDSGDYYLFDVGGAKYKDYDSGKSILVPYLKSMGVRDIKAIFISHEDSDHAGNLQRVVDNFNVKNIITNELNKEGLRKYNPKIIKTNQNIKLKNGNIRCVFEGSEGDENNESLGLLIDIKGIDILTLGDLAKEFEDKLLIKADVLKVSHHGSKTSTDKEFVKNVDPDIALISAGRNNRYGHPNKEVIDNLNGVKIYNTQEDGMVKIIFDKKIKVETFLKGGYFR